MNVKFFFCLRYLFLVSTIFIFFLGCSSDDNLNPGEPPSPSKQEELALADNVKIIDSLEYPLTSSMDQITNGIYQFKGRNLNIEEGDVIVGEEGYGFLRKVKEVQEENDSVMIVTEAASLDELFKSGVLQLNFSEENLIKGQGKISDESYSFNNIEIYSENGLDLTLLSGSAEYKFDWKFDINFNDSEKQVKIASSDSYFHTNFSLELNAERKFEIISATKTLKKWNYHFRITVPVIVMGVPIKFPVIVEMQNFLDIDYKGEVNGRFKRKMEFETRNEMDLGVEYLNGSWNEHFALNTFNDVSIGDREGFANTKLQTALVLKTRFLIYGLAGPFIDNGLHGDANLAVSMEEDWNFKTDAYLKSTIGIHGGTFFKSLQDFYPSFKSESISFETPYNIKKISGDNQIGKTSKTLAEPIKVQVLNSNGQPESGVHVYFQTEENNGRALPNTIPTDENGMAETRWELGSSADKIQTLEAVVKKADGNPIGGAPLNFMATMGMEIDIRQGEGEFLNSDNEVEVEVLVTNAENIPVEDASVNLSSPNPDVSFTPSGPYMTDAQGLLEFKIRVKPENSEGVISIHSNIKLESGEVLAEKEFEIYDNPLIGNWYLVSYFGGLNPGEKYDVYDEACPTIATGWGVRHGVEITFYQDEYKIITDWEGGSFNVELDTSCNIISNHPDSDYGRDIDEHQSEYTFEDGILRVPNELGGESSVQIEFLNDSNTLMKFGEEGQEEVYEKRP